VRALPTAPEVLIVNATGRDHPDALALPFTSGPSLGYPRSG
jgi:hypothetical protein